MIDRKHFFDAVRKPLFGGELSQRQVDGMEAIFVEWDARGLADLGQLAYILTTSYHETGQAMYPIEEYGKGRGYKYPPYYGRGLVQLTWKRNYALFAKRIGVDLVGRPDLALRLDYSVTILIEGMLLGLFTGKRLEQFDFNTYQGVYDARSIINGDKDFPSKDKAYRTRGAMIASYFQLFRAALQQVKDATEETTTTTTAETSVVHDDTDRLVMTGQVDAPEPDPEYLQWLEEKRAQEAEAVYKSRNTKPLWTSLVARSVVAGVAGLLAVKFGIEIPAEYRDIAETAIVGAMGAGALYGRFRATDIITGVFRAKS